MTLAFLPLLAEAQLVKYGPARTSPVKPVKENLANARRHPENVLDLPFWDDFSRVKGHVADSSLWINNDKVFINNGQAINPPSINVATFDGYNAEGLPYATDPAVSGFGDTLESQLIRMADVPLAQRNDIFLSFFYQAGGNSEPPNPSDFLRLQFRSIDGWVDTVSYYIGNNFNPSVFHEIAIQINHPKYFHNEFQFRFISYGRMSGAYDAWHLDYVYLNRRVEDDEETEYTGPPSFPGGNDGYGRPTNNVNENDKNTNMSDRTMTKPFTSIFSDGYFSIPYSHFSPSTNISNPFLFFFNLRDASFDQPIFYNSYFTVTNYNANTTTINSHASPAQPLDALPSRQHSIQQMFDAPLTSLFDPQSDSATIEVRVGFSSGDGDSNGTDGFTRKDFYTRYGNINFFSNDTVQHTFKLSNYYAYDDGIAEYAAGLTQQGNQFAYRFIMKTNAVDTLNGVYIYFPHFGGTSPNSTILSIYKNKNGFPDSDNPLYNQSISIIKTTNSEFTFFKLNEGILVQDTFFIGYRETVTGDAARIRIGLDASHDTGHQMFFRSNQLAAWQVNDVLTGSFMIRPKFGTAEVITSVAEQQKPVTVYPNPSRGEFFMKGIVNELQILSTTGQSIPYTSENLQDGKKVRLQNTNSGVYILRYRSGSKVFTEKILVTH